eukprot:gene22573-29230_t
MIFSAFLAMHLLTLFSHGRSFSVGMFSSSTTSSRSVVRLNMMARKKKELPANPIAVVTGGIIELVVVLDGLSLLLWATQAARYNQ